MTEKTQTTANDRSIAETWKPANFKAEQVQHVSLKDAPDLNVKGQAYHPYSIRFTSVRFHPTAAWTTQVLIYTSKRYVNGSTSIRCTTMGTSNLDEVPAWLEDLTARATPEG
jgi:hypothetical protein